MIKSAILPASIDPFLCSSLPCHAELIVTALMACVTLKRCYSPIVRLVNVSLLTAHQII
jgi:hypothetical protein